MPPIYDLAAWRAQIPILGTHVPLNNCSQAPLCQPTLAAAEAFLTSWSREGMDWDAWLEEVGRARAAFARLVGAAPEEIAVTGSVSDAASAVASALDFSGPRRRVVLSEAEFPTVAHVWQAQRSRGAQLDWVGVPNGMLRVEDYQTALDDRTLLLSASHGLYLSGSKQDLAALARLAHASGALLFVDAYQTLGTCAVDVKALDLDFLVGGCLKYLMGTSGIAFLYVRPELVARLEPTVTGWFGRANPFAFDPRPLDWAPSAARFETGTPPILNAYVARAGIEVILQVGPPAIQAWTEALSARLIAVADELGLQLLGTRDPAAKAPTTAFRCAGDSQAVERRLRARKILVSARGPVVRLAPHFYTTEEELELAARALAEELERG